jgi:ankyrin repeat protein
MPSDLQSFRKSAKALKKAFAAGDPSAIRRLRAVVPGDREPKHADILHVIARESGHESWPKLKFAVEAAAMSRGQRADRLHDALYHGRRWVAEKLLAAEPDLASGRLDLQVATYDLAALRRALAATPSAATTPINGRTPLVHLAFSKYIDMAPEKRADMLAIAELLLAHGADVDDGYPPEPGSKHKLSALYGALGHADNMPLAEWLLVHGASPDDDESLYHATELGHHDGLKLLIRHGVSTRRTNALARALDFDDAEAARLLLEHGADPNEAIDHHPSGEPIDAFTALHQGARRWCSAEIAELILDHGGNPRAVWKGHTPYATARIYGNDGFAEALAARGFATPLSPNEAILAECATGRVPAGRLDTAALHAEDRRLLTRIVWGPERLAHLKALVAAGLDSDHPDEMGLTPLHLGGWEGLSDRVAYLVTLGPDLTHRNRYGGDALSAVLHGAEFNPKADERDHVGCARLLLEAGAKLTPDMIEHCGNEEMALFLEGWSVKMSGD